MSTAVVNEIVVERAGDALLAANDPVEPIHDYSIPIPQHRLPPGKDDSQSGRRRRRDKGADTPDNQHPPSRGPDGHIDEYA